MNEKLSLTERLEHFQQHRIEAGDQYGAEVLHHAIAELAALEAKLETAIEFVEMAGSASNSGDEYAPVCQECGLPNQRHDKMCRLAIWLAAQEEPRE